LHGDDAGSRRFAGADAGGGVFDYQAILRSEAQQRRALEMWLGIRFTAPDVKG
jgi:hypothetical protein